MEERSAGHGQLESPPGGEERGERTEENQTHSEGCRAGDAEDGADGDPGQTAQLCSLIDKLNGQTKGEVEQTLLTNSSEEPAKPDVYSEDILGKGPDILLINQFWTTVQGLLNK